MSDKWAPDRIWLQREVGEGGSHTWCEHLVDEGHEEAEYVRMDVAAAQLGVTEEMLLMRLISALEGECDGLAITDEQASSILAYLQYAGGRDE